MGRMKDVFIQMRAEEYEGDVNTYVKKYAEELNSIKYFCTHCGKTWSYKHDQENEVCPECFSTVIETVIKHDR
jgi:rubrerythrin|tara:strand:+ start:88 stop:306 length:219 start_codon:yes stop_codon:yes gene_type:complete